MDNVGITVIIAHYAPVVNQEKYLILLNQTINSVRAQKFTCGIEIIVCDDGSNWSESLGNDNDHDLAIYDKSQICINSLLKKYDIDLYIRLSDVNKYRGTKLKHAAFKLAKYSKIVVLDDDHPLIRLDSLKLYYNYLDKYCFVRGRLISPKGIPHLYFSKYAQGTNYGMIKEFYLSIGGFSCYLFDNGYGEDNDILMRAYLGIKNGCSSNCKAAYAGEIVTRDLASNRWADRAASQINNTHEFTTQNVRFNSFVEDFMKEFSFHPFKNNPSRKKNDWVELPSIKSWLSELRYTVIYPFYLPLVIFDKISRLKKHGMKLIAYKIRNTFHR